MALLQSWNTKVEMMVKVLFCQFIQLPQEINFAIINNLNEMTNHKILLENNF